MEETIEMKPFCTQTGWQELDGRKYVVFGSDVMAIDMPHARLCTDAAYPNQGVHISPIWLQEDIDEQEKEIAESEKWKNLSEDWQDQYTIELKWPN